MLSKLIKQNKCSYSIVYRHLLTMTNVAVAFSTLNYLLSFFFSMDIKLFLIKFLIPEIKTKIFGEFYSILLDLSKRNNKNFYAFIIFTKERLFYFKIENLNNSSSQNIVSATQDLTNFFFFLKKKRYKFGIDKYLLRSCIQYAKSIQS